jgi:hypothetical protein
MARNIIGIIKLLDVEEDGKKYRKTNRKNQTALWIRLAYGTEKCSISVSMALTKGSNTKMVYNVLKPFCGEVYERPHQNISNY